MKIIHVANTDFEFELAGLHPHLSIEQVWQHYPLCLQLQFLPLLYAQADDVIAVNQLPDPALVERLRHLPWRQKMKLPTFVPLSSTVFPRGRCHAWGASQKVARWAKSRHIVCEMPAWQLVCEINSKAFSFQQAPLLPGSALISNAAELAAWLQATQGKCVLKTCFGLSGKGHYFIDESTDNARMLAFCAPEWKHKRPLVGEPWLERVVDFSTQWDIDRHKGPQLIGATRFETNSKGVYQATWAGPAAMTDYQSFLDAHLACVEPILDRVWKKGFFGYLGVDAFVYRKREGELALQPVVEINARQTMSLAALWFQRQWFCPDTVRLFFSKQVDVVCLLPVGGDRNLTFSLIQIKECR